MRVLLVIYETHEEAERAVEYISQTKLHDKLIRVDLDPGYKEGREKGRGKTETKNEMISGIKVMTIQETSTTTNTTRETETIATMVETGIKEMIEAAVTANRGNKSQSGLHATCQGSRWRARKMRNIDLANICLSCTRIWSVNVSPPPEFLWRIFGNEFLRSRMDSFVAMGRKIA